MARSTGRCSASVVCGALAAGAAAQPDLLWGKQFGTGLGDLASTVAPDGAGGVFVGGFTEGNLGGANAGLTDVYLARYDGAGNRLWIVQFGTAALEEGPGLALDGAGGVFVSGSTEGSLGGPNAGASDAYLARYDGDGNRLWLIQFGTSSIEWPGAPLADGKGGVFVGGTTFGSLGGANAGEGDAYLARFDAKGGVVWLIQFGTNKHDMAGAMVEDGAGGVLVNGATYGTLEGFNPGGMDPFIARYTDQGQRVWLNQYGTAYTDAALGMTSDGAGGAIAAGYTSGSMDGPSAGAYDAFITRFNSAGQQLWTDQFGTSSDDVAWDLVPDGAGGVYLAGDTGGSLGGPFAGASDIFLVGYDLGGGRAWAMQFGTPKYDRAPRLAPDDIGGFFVCGHTEGDLFGPSAGGQDAFVARYGAACYPDFTGDGVLDLFDFLGYVNTFNAGDDAADCDGNGPLDLFDFLCFVNKFNEGC